MDIRNVLFLQISTYLCMCRAIIVYLHLFSSTGFCNLENRLGFLYWKSTFNQPYPNGILSVPDRSFAYHNWISWYEKCSAGVYVFTLQFPCSRKPKRATFAISSFRSGTLGIIFRHLQVCGVFSLSPLYGPKCETGRSSGAFGTSDGQGIQRYVCKAYAHYFRIRTCSST